MNPSGQGHRIELNLLEEGPGQSQAQAPRTYTGTYTSHTFVARDQEMANMHSGDEAQLPLINERVLAPYVPPWKKRRNIIIWVTMGTLLAFLLTMVAITAVMAEREDVDDINESSPRGAPPPGPIPNLNANSSSYVTPTPAYDYRGRPRRAVSSKGMIAADQSKCSEIGANILESGGNAVDAAVATTLCQGVMNPFASGIGGGFFAVIRGANGTSEFIDARETAPAAATWDMYDGMPPNASTVGGLAIAVPLELKGLELMWKRWGRLPWSRLVMPAAELARSGYPAFPYFVYSLSPSSFARLARNPVTAKAYLLPDKSGGWRVPEVGEQCCARPALADTLEAVAKNGVQWLFTPERAASMAQEIRDAGGIMTADDMINTQPVALPVLNMKVHDYELLLPPPPSSAAVMGLALRILSGFKLPTGLVPDKFTGLGSATGDQLIFQHQLVESLKQAFAVRLSLGDPGPPQGPNFVNISSVMADILNETFADELRSDIQLSRVLNVTEYGREWNPYAGHTTNRSLEDDHGTSHLSVVDSQHMAVALTTTVNGGFGSYVMSPSTGILWNNEMDDFSRPDQPNDYGLAPSAINYIAAGKRPLSSMSPCIITQGGDLRMVVGASNGPRIISATLQTIVRILLLGWDALDAVSGPRVHHQLLPYQVMFENYTMPPTSGNLDFHVTFQLQSYLSRLGDNLHGETSQLGNSQVIYLPYGSNIMIGASDPRKDGAPAAPK